MNELQDLLFEIKLASPEAYEAYLDGEGDDRERLHGLRFDLDHEHFMAHRANSDMEPIFYDLLMRLDAILAA